MIGYDLTLNDIINGTLSRYDINSMIKPIICLPPNDLIVIITLNDMI
jgi:hypothetical protein